MPWACSHIAGRSCFTTGDSSYFGRIANRKQESTARKVDTRQNIP